MLLSKSHVNPSKNVNTVTNCAYFDHFRSMISDGPKMLWPFPDIPLSKSHENLSKYLDTVTNYSYLFWNLYNSPSPTLVSQETHTPACHQGFFSSSAAYLLALIAPQCWETQICQNRYLLPVSPFTKRQKCYVIRVSKIYKIYLGIGTKVELWGSALQNSFSICYLILGTILYINYILIYKTKWLFRDMIVWGKKN